MRSDCGDLVEGDLVFLGEPRSDIFNMGGVVDMTTKRGWRKEGGVGLEEGSL